MADKVSIAIRKSKAIESMRSDISINVPKTTFDVDLDQAILLELIAEGYKNKLRGLNARITRLTNQLKAEGVTNGDSD